MDHPRPYWIIFLAKWKGGDWSKMWLVVQLLFQKLTFDLEWTWCLKQILDSIRSFVKQIRPRNLWWSLGSGVHPPQVSSGLLVCDTFQHTQTRWISKGNFLTQNLFKFNPKQNDRAPLPLTLQQFCPFHKKISLTMQATPCSPSFFLALEMTFFQWDNVCKYMQILGILPSYLRLPVCVCYQSVFVWFPRTDKHRHLCWGKKNIWEKQSVAISMGKCSKEYLVVSHYHPLPMTKIYLQGPMGWHFQQGLTGRKKKGRYFR